MTVLEATVEMVKATWGNTGGYAFVIDDEKRKSLIKGITEIYKTLEALHPKPEGKQF